MIRHGEHTASLYYSGIGAVRDLGELNRLLSLVSEAGADFALIPDDYRWKSFKGYMYRPEDIIALA